MPGFVAATPRLILSTGALFARTAAARFGEKINVLDCGASMDAADNYSALQYAIDIAQTTGVPMRIPAAPPGGGWKYSSSLAISAPISIEGDYCLESFGTYTTNHFAIGYPANAPALLGSVLRPASNGQNAFTITGNGISIKVKNLGIEFQTPFADTGDIFNGIPSYQTATLDYANGLSGSKFDSVKGFGHDAFHYFANLTNAIYNRFEHCRSYGGGALNLTNNSSTGSYGNSVYTDFYSALLCGGAGAVNGYNLTGNPTFYGLQDNNAQTFVRPQCNALAYKGSYTAPASNPSSSQFLFFCDDNVVHLALVDGPDFEQGSLGCLVRLPGANGNFNKSTVDWSSGPMEQAGVTFVANLAPRSYFPDGARIETGSFATGGATSGTFTYTQLFEHEFFQVNLTGVGGSAWLSATQPTSNPSKQQAFNWSCAAGTTSINYAANGV